MVRLLPKKTLCADTTGMSNTEKKIMAKSMKVGQDKINFLRKQAEKNQDTEEEED